MTGASFAQLALMQISRGMFLEAEECSAVAMKHYETAVEHLNYAIRAIRSAGTGKADVEPVKTSATD